MKLIRTLVFGLTAGLLAGGYALSQYSYFRGDPTAFALKIDSPPIRNLAALFLVAAIILGFLNDQSEAERPE